MSKLLFSWYFDTLSDSCTSNGNDPLTCKFSEHTNPFHSLRSYFPITSTCLASCYEISLYNSHDFLNINTVCPWLSPLPDSDMSDRQLTWKVRLQVQRNVIACLLEMWTNFPSRVVKIYMWTFRYGSNMLLRDRYITWQIWLQ